MLLLIFLSTGLGRENSKKGFMTLKYSRWMKIAVKKHYNWACVCNCLDELFFELLQTNANKYGTHSCFFIVLPKKHCSSHFCYLQYAIRRSQCCVQQCI